MLWPITASIKATCTLGTLFKDFFFKTLNWEAVMTDEASRINALFIITSFVQPTIV
jgi:hypothetical protein